LQSLHSSLFDKGVAKECTEPGTTKTKLIMLTKRKKLRRASGPIFDKNIINPTILEA
jgi:hypothetical protein